MTVQQIIEEVISICKKQNVGALYLFGSYATESATPTSDIDFFVKGASDIEEIREAVDNIPTLKKIDIFDYDNCLNPELRKAMDQYGKQIYRTL